MKKILLSLTMMAACALGMSATEVLLVGDGSDTNTRVPFNGYYVDTEGTICQVSYKPALLENMIGCEITHVTFYTNTSGIGFDGAKFQISMGEVEDSPFTAYNSPAIEGLTVVATDVTLTKDATEVTIELDQPYTYNGGYLVFESKVTETCGYKLTYFVGTNLSTTEDYNATSRNSSERFLPKTQFTYETEPVDYAARITPASLNFGKQRLDEETTLTLTLTNKGLKPFTPALAGLEAPFSTTYTPAELAPAASVEIPVTFSSATEGSFTATLNINYGGEAPLTVDMVGVAAEESEFMANEGTAGSNYFPYKTNYTDTEGTYAQMIYTADKLTQAKDKLISGLKFYLKEEQYASNAMMEISVAEIDYNEFTRESAIAVPDNLVTDLTVVATVKLTGGSDVWEISFDEPYLYNGGNLVVQTKVTTKGGYKSQSFWCSEEETNVSFCYYGNNNTYLSNTLPNLGVVYREPKSEPETVEFTGIVTDEETGEFIEGVNVTLTVTAPANTDDETFKAAAEPMTYTAVTDENGAFSMDITPVEGATYTLTLAKEGYETVTQEIELGDPIAITMKADENTGISAIDATRVVRVRYINAMGQVSDKPFSGVNVVVTELNDGTKVTGKVVK